MNNIILQTGKKYSLKNGLSVEIKELTEPYSEVFLTGKNKELKLENRIIIRAKGICSDKIWRSFNASDGKNLSYFSGQRWVSNFSDEDIIQEELNL